MDLKMIVTQKIAFGCTWPGEVNGTNSFTSKNLFLNVLVFVVLKDFGASVVPTVWPRN